MWEGGGAEILMRSLDQIEPIVLARGQVRGVFVAPDGQWVGFVDHNRTLKKVAITGGPPLTLTALDGGARGATWAPEDTIIFATNNLATGLQRVSAAGGEPTVVTRPNRDRGEADHLWPEILPGGRGVLFTVTAVSGGLDAAQIAVLDLDTGAQTIVLRGGSHAHYVSTGHLVYTAGGALRAVAFDLSRREVQGTPVSVLPRVMTTTYGAGDYAVAADGTLVYVDAPGTASGASFGVDRTLVWVDRAGREEPLAAPPRAYRQPRLSPDGTRIAVCDQDQEQDTWIWDLPRATLTRLTSAPGVDWFPCGPRTAGALCSAPWATEAASSLSWMPADGTGKPERLTSGDLHYATGLSPDGTHVVFYQITQTARGDLLTMSLEGDHHVQPLLQTPFDEQEGTISPDGRWIAYESDSSGRPEVYVRPFPAVAGGQWQVSTAGGRRPLWARDGQELFYLARDRRADAGTGRGTEHGLERRHSRGPVPGAVLHRNAGSNLRCVPGRPAVSDGQGGGCRPGRRAPSNHRRSALDRRAEAPRADELAWRYHGSRLGPYEIISAARGRRDGRGLSRQGHEAGRDVAIKVLPEDFAHDPERLARFEREARRSLR